MESLFNNFFIFFNKLLVWAKVDLNSLDVDYLTGHIDLLISKNNSIYVIDYKPNSKDFLKCLPQVGMYGLLLKKKINVPNIKIKCLIFNEKKSWKFDPSILLTEIHNISLELDKKYSSFSPIWEAFIESIFKIELK